MSDAYDIASRLIGIAEIPGVETHPMIAWAHSLCGLGTHQPDETPWCSAFVNLVHFLCGLPRSKSAAARSWLPIGMTEALPDLGDVVILNRGGPQDATVIAAPGHVGLYAGMDGPRIKLLGGNQADKVSIASFDASRLLGVRRF